MILEFPRGRVRHASEVDAAPEVPRLAPGVAVLIILLFSLALWAALIGFAIALCGAIAGSPS